MSSLFKRINMSLRAAGNACWDWCTQSTVKTTVLLLGCILLPALLTVLLMNGPPSVVLKPVAQVDMFAGRDFRQTPFELIDAHQVCLHQAQAQHGERLLSPYLDPLSTRFETKKKIWFVRLVANLGDGQHSTEMGVLCEIDPRSYQVVYYKETFEQQPSLLSRTLSFLKR